MEQHPEQVRRAIAILNKWNLKFNFGKIYIWYKRMRLLVHVFGGDIRATDPDKIDDVFDTLVHKIVKQLAAFLGLTNYLLVYIPLYGTLAA